VALGRRRIQQNNYVCLGVAVMDQHPHGGKHSRGWKELNPPEPDNDIKLVDFLLFILAGIMLAAWLLILVFYKG
jgi:hypothetical protein